MSKIAVWDLEVFSLSSPQIGVSHSIAVTKPLEMLLNTYFFQELLGLLVDIGVYSSSILFSAVYLE